MKILTCIVCPRGCRITCERIENEYCFRGNACQKGADYALTELTQPMRTLTTTVRSTFAGVPVIPVRTSKPIPKERIMDVMHALSDVSVNMRVGIDGIIAPRILGLDCDILCTSNILLETERRN